MAAFTASGSGKFTPPYYNLLSQSIVFTNQTPTSQAFTASKTGSFYLPTLLPAQNTLIPRIPTNTVYPRTQ